MNPMNAEPELLATDRCDRCRAQAYVRVRLLTGDLVFCAHHYAESEEKLKPLAIAVQDERHKLSPTPIPAPA